MWLLQYRCLLLYRVQIESLIQLSTYRKMVFFLNNLRPHFFYYVLLLIKIKIKIQILRFNFYVCFLYVKLVTLQILFFQLEIEKVYDSTYINNTRNAEYRWWQPDKNCNTPKPWSSIPNSFNTIYDYVSYRPRTQLHNQPSVIFYQLKRIMPFHCNKKYIISPQEKKLFLLLLIDIKIKFMPFMMSFGHVPSCGV